MASPRPMDTFSTIPDDITHLILRAVVEDERHAALSLVFVAQSKMFRNEFNH
ncbi:hypothetical protein C8J56DRAFT_1060315 [Mycena floridula]|nr:hypothetical protein C8J56DRAFT_1060315 [Mycena floridula]